MSTNLKYVMYGFVAAFTILVLGSFGNGWLGTPLVELDDLKENSRNEGEMNFPQFEGSTLPVYAFKVLMVQSQNLIFSIHPIALFAILMGVGLLFTRRLEKDYVPFFLFALSIPFVFWVGATLADVFVNIRYGIMLYIPLSVAAAMGLASLVNQSALKQHAFWIRNFVILVIVGAHLWTLWGVRPHYFAYQSMLLPKQYNVTDAWGYGAYEAAQYLNTLPEAQDVVIWTDKREVCQFFIGKCITSSRIYTDFVRPSYVVQSRRGSLRTKFKAQGAEENKPESLTQTNFYNNPEFVKTNTVWEYYINDRPESFIRVVRVP